jgi:putative FmdB family regulatory protein
MPIYEYACRKCGEVFSVYQSVSSCESDTKCPKCGSDDVRKRMSSFSCCSPSGGTSFGAPSFGGGFSGGG